MAAKCELCGGEFTKAGLTRHLGSCIAAHSAVGVPAKGKAAAYHVKVEAKYSKSYWLHLHVGADVTLAELDAFLREIWLECCGHLSEFSVKGVRYATRSPWDEEDDDGKDLHTSLRRVVTPGAKLGYVYDFGSSTELSLTVVAGVPLLASSGGPGIRLLARNPPPIYRCSGCGQAATQICTECAWEGTGLLCDDCLAKHPCGEEMALPVVNSPRVGVCGYTG